jgi:hypothetical protein
MEDERKESILYVHDECSFHVRCPHPYFLMISILRSAFNYPKGFFEMLYGSLFLLFRRCILQTAQADLLNAPLQLYFGFMLEDLFVS